MKASLWGYLIMALGIIVITVMLLVSRVTNHAEEDYYLAREIMQASLLDAVDYGAYRTTGRIIISKEKFMEVYIRRFAESVTNSQDYKIDFYDIYEEPPKATVRIRTSSGEATVNSESLNFSVDTLISGILETDYEQYLIPPSITFEDEEEGEDGTDPTEEALEKYNSENKKYKLTYGYTFSANNKTRIYELVKSNNASDIEKVSGIVKETNNYLSNDARLTFVIVVDNLSESEIEEVDNRNFDLVIEQACKYNTEGGKKNQYCSAYYKGEIIYINKSNLIEDDVKSLIDRDEDTFLEVDNLFCNYSNIVQSTEQSESFDYKWVKSGGTITYPSDTISTENKTIEGCELVKVFGCEHGINRNMCKLENGYYAFSSELKDVYECGSKKITMPSNITLKDLENLGDIEQILYDISQNRYLVVVLDQNDVTELGDPIYYFYNLSNKKLYKNYNTSTKIFSNEIAKITMPQVNGKVCNGYYVGGKKLINQNGELSNDFESVLKETYGNAVVNILYPSC